MTNQITQPSLNFSGQTFDRVKDGKRLSSQLAKVQDLMADSNWRSLREIAEAVKGSEAGVSARLRDLRREWNGAHEIEKRRVAGHSGLWQYRLVRK